MHRSPPSPKGAVVLLDEIVQKKCNLLPARGNKRRQHTTSPVIWCSVFNHKDEIHDLEGLARGDADAFNRIYRRYKERVYGFAYRMLGAQSIAEDVTQEAFLVIIQHPGRYRPERGSLLTFLCAIARNNIMKHFRRMGYEVEDVLEQSGPVEKVDEEARDPLTSLLGQELSEKINEAVAALPALQREAIILREFQGLSYEEMAVVIGVKVSVAKVRLHRARQTLARQLAPYLSLNGSHYHELQ